ncbi:MAG: DNA phosphorothioation-associated putative methyltransferase [Alphaproteobacteria bacterium]|nr:DNA phosphorothioation-associated putative methyltransferase [Alphaproteobacteria bacterium]
MEATEIHAKGKVVGLRQYLHVSAIDQAAPETQAAVAKAAQRARLGVGTYNVVRLDLHGGSLSLLDYPGFFDQPFPALARSWKVDTATGQFTYRDYRDSQNPPILHRKELFLPPGHQDVERFAKLTRDLEGMGLFEDTVRIGFRLQWEALLRERGYRVVGHDVVPVGNVEDDGDGVFEADDGLPVFRHLTALSRQSLSAPVSAMLRLGLIDTTTMVFDFGCGRGDDIAGLRSAGITAAGWDPHYAPDNPIHRAQVVNLGFVINVIEDPAERREALQRAYELADVALCVSAMLASEDEVKGKPYADGVLTRRNTFQKYYNQAELRQYVEGTLRTGAIALAPGVFLVFKDPAAEQRFQIGRSRTRIRFLRPPVPRLPRPPKPPKEPKVRVPKVKLPPAPWPRNEPKPCKPDPRELCPAEFDLLCRRWAELGREPAQGEFDHHQELETAFGSLGRAMKAAWERLDHEAMEAARAQRIEDIQVYLALRRFTRRKPYRQLDITLQRDVRVFWGGYASATAAADGLMAEVAAPDAIAQAAQLAAEKGLGWLLEGKSLQLHSSLVGRLPAVLRVYVGCAAILYGDVSMTDLVKIHLASGKVTMMRCDDFNALLPKVIERVKVNLRTQDVRVFNYGPETEFEPLTLYLKTRYMNEEMPGFAEQAEFDRRIEELVDVDELSRGPSDAELAQALREAGLKIDGHAILADDQPPALSDRCGTHLTYRDLIVCGETALSTGLPNLPKQLDSYRALRALAENILDPVINWYGSIQLTYGFSGSELVKIIPARIAPNLDQHAAHELNRLGKPVCPRLGAACDFIVQHEDMLDVAHWVAANTPFDRLYVYGSDRPIHVSFGPEKKRAVFEMVLTADGRRMPKRMKL